MSKITNDGTTGRQRVEAFVPVSIRRQS